MSYIGNFIGIVFLWIIRHYCKGKGHYGLTEERMDCWYEGSLSPMGEALSISIIFFTSFTCAHLIIEIINIFIWFFGIHIQSSLISFFIGLIAVWCFTRARWIDRAFNNTLQNLLLHKDDETITIDDLEKVNFEMKWYFKDWAICLFIVILPPTGLFIMWDYSIWNKWVKLIIMAVVLILGFFILTSST